MPEIAAPPAAATLRALLAASGAAIVVDAECRVTSWTADAARLTSLPAERAIGRPLGELLPSLGTSCREAIAGGERRAVDVAANGPDAHALAATVAPIVDQSGVRGAVIVLREIMTVERERRLRHAILDAIPDALIAYDRALCVTEWPTTVAANTGITRENAVGRSILDLMPYIRGTPIEQEYRRSLAGETVDGRERSWTPAGADEPHFYDVTYYPLRGADGSVRGGVVVTVDTTERRESGETLTAERRLLRTILDANPHSLIAVDRELRIVEWSAKSEQATGLRRAAVLGRHLLDVLPDLAGTAVLENYERAVAGEAHDVRGRWYAIPGAEARAYDVVFAPMYDGEGAPTGAIVLSHDVTDRARAELELASERALLRAVLDAAPASIVAFDDRLRVTEWNRGAERMLGAARTTIVGRRGAEPVSLGAAWAPIAALAARVLEGGVVRAARDTVTLASRSGPAHVESSVDPILDGGRVIGGVAVTVDVTERVMAEGALAASEARFRQLFEGSPVMQILVDADSARIVDANAAALGYFGRDRDSLIGLRPDELVRVPAGEVDARIRSVLESGAAQVHRTFVTPGGARREVEIQMTLLRSTRNRLVHAWMHDVTDRVRAEVERDRLIRIIEQTTDLVAIGIAATRTVTYMNGAGRRLLGVGPDERGVAMADLIAPEDRRRVFEQAFAVAARDGVWRGEVRLCARDGRIVPTSVVLLGQVDPSNGELYLSTVSRDMTEEKRRELELDAARDRAERASQAKSAMLAGLSHELRTPLGAVLGFAQLLRDGRAGPLGAEQAEYVNDVLVGAEHLLRVVNDALDLARVEAGAVELTPEPIDLRALAATALSTLASLARAHEVTTSLEVEPGAVAIVADAGRVRQVLLNFLSNAIKYNRPGGRVRVVVAAEGAERVRLSVHDDGPGIAPSDMDRLFVEFQRFATDRDVPGSGLGLAITKRLVEAMGGAVSVESAPGAGSAFHALLPRG